MGNLFSETLVDWFCMGWIIFVLCLLILLFEIFIEETSLININSVYYMCVDPQIQQTFIWNQYPTHGNQQMHIWDWETRILVSHSISQMQGWFHDLTLWTGDSLEWQQFQKLPQHTKITPCFVIFTKFAHMYQKTCAAHALVKAHLRKYPKMQHHSVFFQVLRTYKTSMMVMHHLTIGTSQHTVAAASLVVLYAWHQHILLNVGCVFMF